ncbi:MAG: hypothetical protein R2704_03410 [Microthrixaceae bacterium]
MTGPGASTIGRLLARGLRRAQRVVTAPLVVAVVGALLLITVALLVTAQRGGA